MDYELTKFQAEHGKAVRMAPSARKRYLKFALSDDALWRGNFRDLSSSVLRMATLANTAVIDDVLVDMEIDKLKYLWGGAKSAVGTNDIDLNKYLSSPQLSNMDLMEKETFKILVKVCINGRSAAEAGRKLFGLGDHQGASSKNDGARVIKMLKKYGLTFDDVSRYA